MVRSLRRCPPPSLPTEGDPLHTWPCLGCGPEGMLIKRVRLLRGRFDLSPPLVLDKFEFFFSNLVKFDTLRCRHRQHLSQGTASNTGALVYFENYRGTGYKLGNVKEICKINYNFPISMEKFPCYSHLIRYCSSLYRTVHQKSICSMMTAGVGLRFPMFFCCLCLSSCRVVPDLGTCT